jgi:hypothetical protein
MWLKDTCVVCVDNKVHLSPPIALCEPTREHQERWANLREDQVVGLEKWLAGLWGGLETGRKYGKALRSLLPDNSSLNGSSQRGWGLW